MATILALTLLLLARPQTPDTTTFTDAALGLSFSHPTTWTTVATPVPVQPKGKGNRFKLPRGKKNDGPKPPAAVVTFRIPGKDGNGLSELTITPASFSDAPEKWQQIQADANKNLNRDVERQWQQEILGVPLLLTRIAYSQDGKPTTVLTGLLYNAAPYKLLFRLTGPTGGFDDAQFQFTQAMESLRTTTDTLPTVQEPGKPIAPPVEQTPDAKHTLFIPPKKAPKPAPLTLPVSIGERKMLLRVPLEWKVDKVEGDSVTLRHPDLKEPVQVRLYAAATAPRPTEALTAAANETLKLFTTVELREDTPGTPNNAGNPVLAIWRRGTAASGPLATLDAVAVAGDYYAILSFRPTPGEPLNRERKTVQTMLDALGLEPAP